MHPPTSRTDITIVCVDRRRRRRCMWVHVGVCECVCELLTHRHLDATPRGKASRSVSKNEHIVWSSIKKKKGLLIN